MIDPMELLRTVEAREDAQEQRASDSAEEAINEALIVNCIDMKRKDETWMQALARLVEWERVIALDPRVSNEARDLQQQPAADAVALLREASFVLHDLRGGHALMKRIDAYLTTSGKEGNDE